MARAPSNERVRPEDCDSGAYYRPTTIDSAEDDFGTDKFGNEHQGRFADEDDGIEPLDKLFR